MFFPKTRTTLCECHQNLMHFTKINKLKDKMKIISLKFVVFSLKAYYFSPIKNIVGVELNKELCELQKLIALQRGMKDRVQVHVGIFNPFSSSHLSSPNFSLHNTYKLRHLVMRKWELIKQSKLLKIKSWRSQTCSMKSMGSGCENLAVQLGLKGLILKCIVTTDTRFHHLFHIPTKRTKSIWSQLSGASTI